MAGMFVQGPSPCTVDTSVIVWREHRAETVLPAVTFQFLPLGSTQAQATLRACCLAVLCLKAPKSVTLLLALPGCSRCPGALMLVLD